MIKYSILMPYHKRAGHLHNTFISFIHHYRERNDYEVIIVEDIKNTNDYSEHSVLLKEIELFSKEGIVIVYLFAGNIDSWNPSSLFNEAAKRANGKYLIITNPECFHKTDILVGLDEEFKKDSGVYVVCACESVKNCKMFIDNFHKFDGIHHRWYQHSIHRNEMYHFCTAISKKNWEKIGGFDERFSLGVGYDDNDFRDGVIAAKIPIVLRDDLHTIHQWHGKTHCPDNHQHLLRNNEKLYQQKRIERGFA